MDCPMAFYESFDPHARFKPLTVIGGFQLYLIQVLVLVHTAGMVATALFSGFGGGGYAALLDLQTVEVLQGEVWRLVTYAYVDAPSIWFAISMLIIFFGVGQGVEEYVGRGMVLALYAAMILIPSLVLTAITAVLGSNFILAGCLPLMFGFFVAFCTLYPGVVMSFFFFQISMKMAAWILLGINSLIYISANFIGGLYDLWLCSAIAFFGLKFIGVQGGFGRFTEWMESKRLERDARRQKLKVLRKQERERSIDEILDKISKQGKHPALSTGGYLPPSRFIRSVRARSRVSRSPGVRLPMPCLEILSRISSMERSVSRPGG